ncbi:MAG: signal peptidase I [Pseudomonadota bacterium]
MDFALIMFIALVITGVIWLLDSLFFKPKRPKDAKLPVLTEYAKSFFPVILAVFMLRSFLVEPFKIPSGSMIPTLLVGDFILVNKYTYGIRLPIINKKIINVGEPKKGDVMVFRYPKDPSLDYIKRVVGVPGDTVTYSNKRLTINGQALPTTNDGSYSYIGRGLNYVTTERYKEQLGQHLHSIITQSDRPSIDLSQVDSQFPHRENCDYNDAGFTCKVPQGYYFMMGDNRDDSTDSRYWGFVPERNIVGRAFMVWWNFDHLKRIGHILE